MVKKKTDTDEIWPRREGGPKVPGNQRETSPHENRSKGARMPNINEIGQSPNPVRLASEIDKYTIEHKLTHPSNTDKGFGGLSKLHP